MALACVCSIPFRASRSVRIIHTRGSFAPAYFLDLRTPEVRRLYAARRTLESLSVKLRDETDLEAPNDVLAGVVRETVQPTHVTS